MTTIELNAALKRLKAISDSLIDCEIALSDCSKKLEKTAYELNMAKNLVAVQYCPKCINCTSTLADGAHCTLSKLPVGNRDYCSRFKIRPDSLCWDCKNSTTNGCSWAKSFTPVDGWEAIPSVAGTSDSYCVFECPKFEKG